MEAELPMDTDCPEDPQAGAELPGEDSGAAEVLVSRRCWGPSSGRGEPCPQLSPVPRAVSRLLISQGFSAASWGCSAGH